MAIDLGGVNDKRGDRDLEGERERRKELSLEERGKERKIRRLKETKRENEQPPNEKKVFCCGGVLMSLDPNRVSLGYAVSLACSERRSISTRQ